jgi:hypothetical protein
MLKEDWKSVGKMFILAPGLEVAYQQNEPRRHYWTATPWLDGVRYAAE